MADFRAGQILAAQDLNRIQTPAVQHLETQELGSPGTFTFPSDGSNLPQDGHHLLLEVDGKKDGTGLSYVTLQFNGDTATNYTWHFRGFDGTGAALSQNDWRGGVNTMTVGLVGAPRRSSMTVKMTNYSSSVTKSVHATGMVVDNLSTAGDMAQWQAGGVWNVSSPIETFALELGGGNNYDTSTMATLYILA